RIAYQQVAVGHLLQLAVSMADHPLEGQALGEAAVFLAIGRADQGMQGIPASALGLLRFDGLLSFLQAFPGAVIVLQAVAQSAAQLAYLSQRCLPGCQLPGQLLQRLLGQLAGLLRREALTAVADAHLQLGVAPLQLPGLTTQTFPLSRRQHRRPIDRKSTRLNSSHVKISYAVICLKEKK